MSDRSAVVDLLARQLDEHDIPIESEALLAAIDGILTDERRGLLLLAKHEGQAIGVAYVSLTWSIEHGGQLLAGRALRPAGMARARCRHFDARIGARGGSPARVPAVDLEVESAHQRASRLYARHGFARHSRTRWVKVLDR